MPKRLRRYDERLATHGLQTVILIRATLFLAPPAHWLLGLSQVRFTQFLLGTAIGFLPGIALLTYLTVSLGESLGEWIEKRPPGTLAAIIIAIVVFVRIRRRIARRREGRESASGEAESATGNSVQTTASDP
jgi:phospholipase D1/2